MLLKYRSNSTTNGPILLLIFTILGLLFKICLTVSKHIIGGQRELLEHFEEDAILFYVSVVTFREVIEQLLSD